MRLFSVFIFLFMTASASADGFRTFAGFVKGLAEMPVEKFTQKANETPRAILRGWKDKLEELNPEPFEKWNAKLRTIHGPGFAKNSDFWELHPLSDRELVMGYKPKPPEAPFSSIVEFYQSFKKDTAEVFQSRASRTPGELIGLWLNLFSRAHPESVGELQFKMLSLREVGFKSQGAFIPKKTTAEKAIGFGKRDLESINPFHEYDDFLHSVKNDDPGRFRRRLAVTTQEDAKNLTLLVLQKDESLAERFGFLLTHRNVVVGLNHNPTAEKYVPKGTALPVVRQFIGGEDCFVLLRSLRE